jgi:hypothetical protein
MIRSAKESCCIVRCGVPLCIWWLAATMLQYGAGRLRKRALGTRLLGHGGQPNGSESCHFGSVMVNCSAALHDPGRGGVRNQLLGRTQFHFILLYQ